MSRGDRYTAPKPADRTLRVWDDGRDVTDEDPAGWHWPYADWWAAGWRPLEGPNSTVPGLTPGGVGPNPAHGTGASTDPAHYREPPQRR